MTSAISIGDLQSYIDFNFFYFTWLVDIHMEITIKIHNIEFITHIAVVSKGTSLPLLIPNMGKYRPRPMKSVLYIIIRVQ